MNLSLNGQHAFVCGSTQGIGKAAAFALAEMGATITLLARNADKLKAVQAALPTPHSQQHGYLAADFSQPERLGEKVADYLVDIHTPVTILVNNTGGPPGGPITEATADAFLAAFYQHLISNHTLVQAVLPGMRKAGMGRIINVISTSVKAPLAGLGVSNTIRGAVANWAKTMANELGKENITVNNVLPGATATERLNHIIHNKANKTGTTEAQVAQQMRQAIPMQRFAEPEEVAHAIAFLASPAASYITGINLPVDGGRTPNL